MQHEIERRDSPHEGLVQKRSRLASLLPAIAALVGVFGALFVWAFFFVDPLVVQFERGLDGTNKQIFRNITHIGKSDWILFPTGLAVLALTWLANSQNLLIRRIRYAHLTSIPGFVFLCVAGSGIAAQIIKQIIGRARPKYFEALGSSHFNPFSFTSDFASFPSGHATTIFALATALALLVPRARFVLIGAAIIIASTRFLIGAHYLTDVIAGGALGISFPYYIRHQFARRDWLFRPLPNGGYARRHSLFSMRMLKSII